MKFRVLAVGILLGASMLVARAQPMLLDDSFAPRIVLLGGGVTALALDAEGRIVVGGVFETIGGIPRKGLARVNADGTGDPTFNPGPLNDVSALAVLNDGQILVGGAFTNAGGATRVALARFAASGQLDTSFDAQFNPEASVRNIALQPDGKILLAGSFTHVQGWPRKSLVRLHPDGAVDTSFDPGAGPDLFIITLIVDRGGKIVVGGTFINFNMVRTPYLARLLPDGNVDPTFNTQTPPDSWVQAVREAPDGKLWIGGSFNNIGEHPRNYLARLNEDGTLDTALVPATLISGVTQIMLQGQNVIVSGRPYIINDPDYSGLARLHDDGSHDTAFNAGDACESVAALQAMPDGNLLVGNNFTQQSGEATNILVRLQSDGQRRTAFRPEAGRAGEVRSLVAGNDRSITFLGAFSHVNGIARNGVARVRHDGSLDTSFDPMRRFASHSSAAALCLAHDGSYLMVGNFRQGKASHQLVRVSAEGTPIPIPTPGFSLFRILQVREQPDGKILVAGSKYHNSQTRPLQRFWPDGRTDTNFSPVFEQLALPFINDLVIEPDGKITIAGEFRIIDGIPRFRIARLHSDGSVDETFDPGLGPNQEVRALVRQPDGRYILGGKFYAYNDVYNREKIARVLPSGALDDSFHGNFYSWVYAMALQDDGKIFAGGEFVYGPPGNRIARFNANGFIDPSFDPGAGADQKVNALKISVDGDLLVAGAFSQIGGKIRFGLARYLRLPRFAVSQLSRDCRQMRILAPEGQTVIIETSADLAHWTSVWTNTAISGFVDYSPCEPLDRPAFYRALLQ